MNRRICPHCHENSYSAYDGPDWICPYCGNTMGHVPNERELVAQQPIKAESSASKVVYFRKSLKKRS